MKTERTENVLSLMNGVKYSGSLKAARPSLEFSPRCFFFFRALPMLNDE